MPQNVRECQEFLPQVYEVPKDHLQRLRERGELGEAEVTEAELERYRRVYVEQPIRLVLEVVGDPVSSTGSSHITPLPHVVILGDPGSGKSTLLQYIALVWAERPLSELPLHPIPLLIELRTYARDKQEKKCNDILSFIHSGNITCRLNQQQLHKKLKAGHAIALFDGVDEVFDPQLRDEVVTDIHRFTNDYPQVQAIVTSRWLGYKAHQLKGAEFRHFMLQDLEDEQIKAFIQCWHDLMFSEGADKTRKQERLQKAIEDSKAIRELAGNPLLLTMMAILNRNQELPRDRPELYNQASRVLLHQWDVERNLIEHRLDPMTIDYRDKQAMLRKVAYHMQSSEKGLAGNIISATDLETILTDYLKTIEVSQPRTVARLMINQLRTRNFILCYLGAESYAFVHRTFLEYFCAWEFVWQFKEAQTLTIEQLKNQVFGKHWQDETWHEVFRLISGMIDERFLGEIIEYLLTQADKSRKFINLFLAAECLLEARNRSTIKEMANSLLKYLKDLVYYYKPFEEYHNDGSRAVDGNIAYICSRAIKAIKNTWMGDVVVMNWLEKVAQSDNWVVKLEAAEAFSDWKENPERFSWLKSLLVPGINCDIQLMSLKKMAKEWSEDLEIFDLLFDCANRNYFSSNDEEVAEYGESPQQEILGIIDQYYPAHPKLKELLFEKAKLGLDCSIRAFALNKLAEQWQEDPAVFYFIKACAMNDREPYIRIIALQLLGNWKDKSEVFVFLRERTLIDPFERKDKWQTNPRKAALEEMIKNYPDNPQTLELISDRATNDPDEKVREFAKQQLAELEEQRG